MKKILYITITALLFMACSNNEPDFNVDDQKVLDMISTKILTILEKDTTYVNNEFENIGFRKESVSNYNSFTEVYYRYSPVDGEFFDAVKIGRIHVEAVFYYRDNKLYNVNVGIALPLIKNIGATYMKCSNNLYKSLPVVENTKKWEGELVKDSISHRDSSRSISYESTERSDFEADMKKYKDTFSATERGRTNDHDGKEYVSNWNNPDEEMRQEMEKGEGGVSYAILDLRGMTF